MSEEKHHQFLRIPLYKLYYVDDRAEIQAAAVEMAARICNDYSTDEFRGIVNGLEWAIRQPHFPFSWLLPGLAYSNGTIHSYFLEVLKQVRENPSALVQRLSEADRTYPPEYELELEVNRIKEWLINHPAEAAAAIAAVTLTKYDSSIAEVLGRIGSPVADRSAAQLVGLMADINWPVYDSAIEALFSLNKGAILDGIFHSIALDDHEGVRGTIRAVFRRKPIWTSELLSRAVSSLKDLDDNGRRIVQNLIIRELENQ